MDDSRFDRLTRTLARGASRRTVLKTLAGSLLGLGVVSSAQAETLCGGPGVHCVIDDECCLGSCENRRCACPFGQRFCDDVCAECCYDGDCLDNGRCEAGSCVSTCLTAGQDGCADATPCCAGHACCGGTCLAGADCCTAQGGAACGDACCGGATPRCCQDGTCIPDGGCCGDGDCAGSAEPCRQGVCQPDHTCGVQVTVGASCASGDACTTGATCQSDGTCGSGTAVTCDDGLACTTDSCDAGTGCVHTLQEGFCLIAGACYASGDANPGNACQVCDPDRATAAWSDETAGAACGAGTVCRNGACQSGCVIDGTFYQAGATNPGNACQSCQPANSTTGWSVAVGAVCLSNCQSEYGGVHTWTCSAAGKCVYTSFIDCSPYAGCNAAGTACATRCTADSDCRVEQNYLCINRTCQAKRTNGASCNIDVECDSGHCCGNICSDLAHDSQNCGQCGHACAAGGVCCDGTCTDLRHDLSNCGACGSVCSMPNAKTLCEYGDCVFERCHPGYGSCDRNLLNGCETHTDSDPKNCGACGHVCGTGESCCGGRCVDLQSDVAHCGICGSPCHFAHGSGRCVTGICIADTCEAGYTPCFNNDDSRSCVDLATNPDHCSACGMSCPAGQICCGGACLAPLTDQNNCGACGHSCPPEHGCCDGRCTDLQRHPHHCGACGQPCPTGLTCCGGQCVDLLRDTAHCGACGNACSFPSGTLGVCASGTCRVASCAAGYTRCDNGDGTSSCVDLRFDSNHCGSCGNVCPCQGYRGGQCYEGTCCLDNWSVCHACDLPCCYPSGNCSTEAGSHPALNTWCFGLKPA